MRLGIAKGPLLLLAWQVAPIGATRDSTGRARLALGYGAGQYESRSLDCAGNVISSRPVPYSTVGARVDLWTSRRIRLTGFGGVLATSPAERYHGSFGGGLVALEGQYVGIGLGPAWVSGTELGRSVFGTEPVTRPSLYLRFGSIDKGHFRGDFLGPEAAFGTTGLFRIGIGFNQGHLAGVSGFLGAGVRPYGDQSALVGGFGELGVPIGSRLDITLAGGIRSSAQHFDGGVSAGVRYNVGK